MEHQELNNQNNIHIKVSKSDAELLEKLAFLKVEKQANEFFIVGTKEFYSRLLDKLSDKLSEVGFNKNDEPNEIGLKIEDLIDKFTPLVYD